MGTMMLAGVLSALGAFFILLRLGRKFMVRWALPIDIAFTIMLAVVFFGTFSGMMAAAVGAVILSVLLWAVKMFPNRA